MGGDNWLKSSWMVGLKGQRAVRGYFFYLEAGGSGVPPVPLPWDLFCLTSQEHPSPTPALSLL